MFTITELYTLTVTCIHKTKTSVRKRHIPIAVPQDLDSDAGPVQGAPHSLPATHVRVRVCVPIPHLTEQALHAPYDPIRELTDIRIYELH